MKTFFVLTAFSLSMILSSPATSQENEYVELTKIQFQLIDADTRAIESGKFQGVELAERFSSRGQTWELLQDFNRALKDHNEAVRLAPMSKEIRMARARFSTYDSTIAIADYNEVLKIDPNDPFARLGRGNLFLEGFEFDRALADFNYVIERNQEASTLGYRARCRARIFANKELDLARKDCDHAIAKQPNWDSYFTRALLHIRQNNLDDASKDLDEVEKQMSPNLNIARFARGIIDVRRGRRIEGYARVQQAVSGSGQTIRTYMRYGLAP
jgi:tetratricopeptide (TPR) repeat protein